MADKELTTFVVDVSKYMNSDLDLAKRYINEILATKCMRARKTDYVGVIAVRSSITENPYAGDVFQNIHVIADRIAPKYKDMIDIERKLQVNSDPLVSENNDTSVGDVFEGLMLAVSLMKDTANLKYVRNIIILTNGRSPIHSFEGNLTKVIKDAIAKLNINLVFIGIGFDQQVETPLSPFQKAWKSKISELSGHFMTGKEAIYSLIFNPPLKTVRPIKNYRGLLRFGADPSKIHQNSWSFQFTIEVYPATKIESLPNAHLYWLDKAKNDHHKVGYKREYYIRKRKVPNNDVLKKESDDGVGEKKVHDSDSEDQFVEEQIDPSEKVKGLKFSNYDLIPIDEILESAINLATFSSMDILGFYKKEQFCYAYLTDQAFYVVPGNGVSMRDITGFNSFCQAMDEMGTIAIVRYVPKDNSEISICALMPNKIAFGKHQIYACNMIRLPFKEDENIGRFPLLVNSVKMENPNESVENNLKFPSAKSNELMEAFILSKAIDIEDDSIIDIPKVVATSRKEFSFPFKSKKRPFNFIEPSPGIHKFNLNLHKIIAASLKDGDLNKINIKKIPSDSKFLSDNSKKTNLFNLKNVLALNGNDDQEFLSRLNKKSETLVLELIKELEVKYVTKEETERQRQKLRKPNLHELFSKVKQEREGKEDQNKYDEMPDIDRLLAGNDI